MPETTNTVVAPPSSSSAWKAQDPRKGAPDEAALAAEYAAVASQAHANAAMLTLNASTAGGPGSKSSSQNLPGAAARDRGSSSRTFSDRASAVSALGGTSDPTSRAIQELKTLSSRHDPSARLEGKVPTDSNSPGSETHASDQNTPREAATTRITSSNDAKPNANMPASTAQSPASTSSIQAPTAASAAATAVNAASNAVQPKTSSTSNQTNLSLGKANSTSSLPRAGSNQASQTGGKGAQNQSGSGNTNTGGKSSSTNSATSRAFEISTLKTRGKARPSTQPPTAQDKTVPAQAQRGLAAVLRQKGGNVTLRLAPDSLGDLKISMKLDGPQVWASIQATNESARQLLMEQRDTLREALEAQGLKVERLDIPAVKHEAGSETGRTSVKDHAAAPNMQDSARPDSSATTGEDRPSAESWGRTPQGSAPGRSAEGTNQEAGGAGDMLLTVRGAPVNVWAEAQGSTMRLRVDAVA